MLIRKVTDVHKQEGYLDQQSVVSMSDRERQVDRIQISADKQRKGWQGKYYEKITWQMENPEERIKGKRE